MGFREDAWNQIEEDRRRYEEKAIAEEIRNAVFDAQRAKVTLQEWIAMEQMFAGDGWTAFASWLGRAYDAACKVMIASDDRVQIRIAPGTAQLALDILNLPSLVAEKKVGATSKLHDAESRMRDAERSADSLTA